MKTLLVALAVVALAACGEPDAKRIEVKKELKDFTELCKANPQAPECVAHKANTQGGG